MNKAFRIFRHEITTLVSRFSFWFGVLGVPLIGFLVIGGIGYINNTQGTGSKSPMPDVSQLFSPKADPRPQGYVDNSNLLSKLSARLPSATWIQYKDVDSARKDLDAKTISAFYVIPADYISTGKVFVYAPEYNLVASEERSSDLRSLLDFSLLSENPRLAAAVQDPLAKLKEENISTQARPVRDENNAMTFILPYAMMMFSFITIMGSSSLMLSSITKEKENRIMEVLMSSASPHQILMGKIAGLGLVGLLQVVIWISSGLVLLQISGRTLSLPPEFLLHPSIIFWAVLYFVFGYLVNASLMAGIGALVPSLREASQATMVVTIPLMAPLFLISALVESPNSGLATFLSIFPFTSPMTMMLRLSAVDVPLWQLLTSLALLAATAFLVARAVAGMFRAQTIMSGQPFNLKRLALALIGR